ncbi:hypothetical protein G6F56_000444 [Rhizopus delemar]|nr:hypothetical protein G6F56_000444 [Rhizopus delemar]
MGYRLVESGSEFLVTLSSTKFTKSSGKKVVDDQMKEPVEKSIYEHPVYSMTFDPDDIIWKNYFTPTEIIFYFAEKETPLPACQPGVPKKLNERDLRHLQAITRKDPFASNERINSQLKLCNISISHTTLITYIKELGFGFYFAAHKPAFTEENKKRRLRWAKERVNWTKEQCEGVVWSDESLFTVEGYDGGARVLRKIGERYQAEHISKWGKGNSVNQDACINILSNKSLPWFVELNGRHGKDFIFQEDGASCHTGGYVTWWKNYHQIRRFDYWPAQSPDLNPIEHLWSCLERLICNERSEFKNADELKAVLEAAWGEIHVDLADRLVGSMKDRCQVIIDAKGGPTKY